MSFIRHPKTWFTVRKSEEVGVWAVNRDGTFERRLLRGLMERLDLSPNLDQLAVERPWANTPHDIYLLQLTSDPRSRGDQTFRVEIPRTDLINGFRGQQDFAWFANRFNEWQKEGTFISGGVFSPRINPLNGKAIGAGDNLKAYMRVLEIHYDHLIVKIVSEMSRPAKGDVISSLQHRERSGSILHFGGDLWGILTDEKAP